MSEVGAAITSSVTLEDALTAVARRVAEAFGVWECDFYEYDAARREITAAACWCTEMTPEDEAWIGQTFPIEGVHHLSQVFDDREILEEQADDPEMSAEDVAFMDAWGELTAVSVPLIFENEVLGCLSLIEKREPRRFDESERELLRALALPAAAAIHDAKVHRDLQDRARQLDSLLDSSNALASSVVLEDVLALVARKVAEALDVSSCLIYEYASERDALVLRSEYTDGADVSPDDAERTFHLADYPHDREVLFGETVVEQRIDDPLLDPFTRRDMSDNLERSCLSVPVRFKGDVLGLVEIVERRRDRSFTVGEIDLARALGKQAAVAMHNAGLYRRLEVQNRRLNAFVGLSEQMEGLVDEGQMLSVLGRVMAEVLDYRQWSAYLLEPEKNVYKVVGSIGPASEIEQRQAGREIPARVIDGLVAASTSISRSWFVDHHLHTWTDEEHFWLPAEKLGERGSAEWHFDDTLFVPMRTELGELIGYIEAYDPVDRLRPTEEGVRLLEVFAAKAASSIELNRLYERLAEQASTDGLTGLANRRCFGERLEEEIAKARRYGTPLSLLMLDLDDFKPFNDRYGHPQGDKALCAVAAILRGSTRAKVDLVARYGGEEFVVLLPSTPAAGAATAGQRIAGDVSGESRDAVGVAETIRRTMDESLFEGHPSREDVHVTVSVGVASYPEHAADADELVANADKALYLAKRIGKNCVRLFG